MAKVAQTRRYHFVEQLVSSFFVAQMVAAHQKTRHSMLLAQTLAALLRNERHSASSTSSTQKLAAEAAQRERKRDQERSEM